MYLHLGQDTVVTFDEIIGIFDLDTSTVSKHTRDYLAKAEKSGDVINVSTELPKTFVVTADGGKMKKTRKIHKKRKVYISQISSATLLKRVGNAL